MQARGVQPGIGRADDAGAHRIQLDVSANRQQVGVAIYQHGLEPALEEMPHLGVAPVEGLRVHAIDLPHQQRQVGLVRVLHEVIVVPHQAIGQHLGIKALHRLCHHLQQGTAVRVVHEDRLAPVAARGDVVDRAGEPDAQWAGHAGSLGGWIGKNKT